MNEQQALEKLEEYFKGPGYLKILDSPSPSARNRGGYLGVTMEYLEKYVVPGIEKRVLVNCINTLLENRTISNYKCYDIRELVFERCNHLLPHIEYPITLSTISRYYAHDEEE